MCPLRFILVFFSAILAGFLAWKSFRSAPELDTAFSEDLVADKPASSMDDHQEKNLKMVNILFLFIFFFWDFFSVICFLKYILFTFLEISR